MHGVGCSQGAGCLSPATTLQTVLVCTGHVVGRPLQPEQTADAQRLEAAFRMMLFVQRRE